MRTTPIVLLGLAIASATPAADAPAADAPAPPTPIVAAPDPPPTPAAGRATGRTSPPRDADCAPSDAPVTLGATFVVWPASLSFAVVDDGRTFGGRFVSAGAHLAGRTVAAVERGLVVLRRGDRLECLRPGARAAAAVAAPVPQASVFTVESTWLRAQLADLRNVARWARVRPHLGADGRLEGFRLDRVRGPLPRLGARDGDILTAVDGRPLDSPNAVLAALDRLQTADRIAVEVRRDGRPVVLAFQVR